MNVPLPGVTVDPQGVSTSVAITDSLGNTPTAYSDHYGINTVALPDTITTRTTFFLPGEGPWTITPTASGQITKTTTLTLEDSQVATITVGSVFDASQWEQLGAYVQRAGGTTATAAKSNVWRVEDYWDLTGDPVPGIQAAIDAASAAGGGIVESGPLTFTCATAPKTGPGVGNPAYCLDVPSNVWLKLHPAATLTQANGLNAGIVLIATNANNVTVGPFAIDGNKANQTDSGNDGAQCGVYGSTLTSWTLNRLTVQHCIRQGVYISNSSWGYTEKLYVISNGTATNNCSGFEDDANDYCDFVNTQALDNAGVGLRVVGGSSLSDINVTVTGGAYYGNQYGIMTVDAQGSQIIGVRCRANSNDGLILENSDGCAVIGGWYDHNGRHGIYDYQGTNNTLTASTCRDNAQTGGSGGVGINVFGSTNTTIESARCYDDQTAKTQPYGIQIDSTSASVSVNGGNLTGNGSGAVNNSSTSSVVSAARGYNPVGAAVTQPAVPASGAGAANNSGVDCTVYVTGGTSCSVVINGTTLADSPVAVHVPAGKTITLFYTAAPTWEWYGH